MRRKGGVRWRGDRGTLSLFVVLFTPVVVLLAALLVDGGIAINARERAADVAQQAARAGANDLSVAALRSGTVALAPDACGVATEFVTRYTGIGAVPDGCTTYENNGVPVVKVTATVTVQSQILGMFIPQYRTFTEHASGAASPVCGITQGGQC